MPHTNGVLVRILERGTVGDACGIEHHDVREHALREEPTTIELEVGCRDAAQLTDSRSKRQHMVIADVLGEDARKIPVRAWMGGRFREGQLGRHRRGVRAEGYPGE